MITNCKGSFHVVLCFITFLLIFTGMGIWAVLRDWSKQVETQLQLDRCIGMLAKDFERKLNRLYSLNQSILLLRTTMVIDPTKIPILRESVRYLAITQDFLKTQWETKRLKWLIAPGCVSFYDRAFLLPSLKDFRRPIVDEDPLGKKPLFWSGEKNEKPSSFYFQIANGSRKAAAEVTSKRDSNWTSRWCVPLHP